jgi:hypothetical protein
VRDQYRPDRGVVGRQDLPDASIGDPCAQRVDQAAVGNLVESVAAVPLASQRPRAQERDVVRSGGGRRSNPVSTERHRVEERIIPCILRPRVTSQLGSPHNRSSSGWSCDVKSLRSDGAAARPDRRHAGAWIGEQLAASGIAPTNCVGDNRRIVEALAALLRRAARCSSAKVSAPQDDPRARLPS